MKALLKLLLLFISNAIADKQYLLLAILFVAVLVYLLITGCTSTLSLHPLEDNTILDYLPLRII
ncbi:MAG: hypothetical protein [Microvirus sp.]|nr:MAG: hypothetical protein [Microvirus sp.]